MRRKHNRITNYYKDKAGNEIIETQTYYTVPENDWEFDEDQKLSYNNPVFVELCKRRGKNFDELNTGWVPQHKIGEEPEEEEEIEEEEEEDEFDEDDDLDDVRRHKDQSKALNDSKKDNDDEPVTFKFGGKKNKDNKTTDDKSENKSVKAESPDLKKEDLEAMFGPSNNSDTETKSDINSSSLSEILQSTKSTLESVTNTESAISNRDRISAALNNLDKNDTENNVIKPRIKLNIDKSETTQSKKSIKLNLKPKNE